MNHWSETLEAMVNDSLSGKLEKMEKDIITRLQPFDIDDGKRLVKDWQAIREYEELTDRYIQDQGYLLGSKLDESVLKAIEQVNSIDKKLQIKKRFCYTQLADNVIEAQQHAQQSAEVAGIQQAWERLDGLQDLAQALDQPRIEVMALKAKEACDLRIEELGSRQATEQEKATAYERFISEATDALHKKTSIGRMRELRERMEGFREHAAKDDFRNAQLEGFISKYDETIQSRTERGRRRARRFFAGAALTGVALGIAYLGYVGVRAAADKIEGKVEQYKESKAEELGLEQVQEQAAHYEAMAEQKQEELQSVAEQLSAKRAELETLESQRSSLQEQASILPQAYEAPATTGVAGRLSPVLGNTPLTLYIEKSSNHSYVLNQEGKVLFAAGHTDASDPGKKTLQGQNRTPEGIYSIEKGVLNDGSRDGLYGIGFIRINYPTPQEQRAGFTGSGVLLCSAANSAIDRAIDEGRDVMVCGVAYHDNDFKKIFELLKTVYGQMQVVIEDYDRRPLAALGQVER